MRAVSNAVTDAVNATSAKQSGRVTAFKSRTYFKEADLNEVNKIPLIDTESFEQPMQQSMGYNTEIEKFITVYIDGNLNVSLATHDGSADMAIEVVGGGSFEVSDQYSRPAIFENKIYYYSDAAGGWVCSVFDPALLDAGDSNCLVSTSDMTCLVGDVDGLQDTSGAVYPTSETTGFIVTLHEGAILVSYWDSSVADFVVTNRGRIFNPTYVTGENVTDIYSTHYAAAVFAYNRHYLYVTAPNGEVKAVSYEDGAWSDYFIAIPSDLSQFKVSSAAIAGGSVFLCGSFQRSGIFESDYSYTLLCKSIDGYTFSLDRKTLVSLVPYRFMVAFDGEDVFFSSGNRWFREIAPYQMIGESTSKTVLESNSISGNSSSGWTVSLVAGNEMYYDNPYLKTGFFSKLEIAVWTGSEFEYILYHETIIGSISKGIRDGERQMDISLVPDAKWHTSAMTHPFYLEMIGKQGEYDPTRELNKLSKLTPDGGIEWPFAVDLWGSVTDGAAYGPDAHPENDSRFLWTADLLTIFTEYPTFKATPANVTVKVYGWSRAGAPDTNPNTSDITSTTGPNDKFYAVLEMVDVEGNDLSVTTLDAQLTSDHLNPPQTYFEDGARDGSYPVEFTIPNPGEGVSLKRVAFKVVSTTVRTTFFVERIEIPELTGLYITNIPYFDDGETTASFAVRKPANLSWVLKQTLPLNLTTNNKISSDIITSMALTDGMAYAVIVKGSVAYTQDTKHYIQDAEYYCDSPDGFADPTWARNYPPGNKNVYFSGITVGCNEFLAFSPTAATTFKDAVQTTTKPNADHQYIFKTEELGWLSSKIKNTHVPYVYSNGDPLSILLHTPGTGAPSQISGSFTVYIFESPVPFNQFQLYSLGSYGSGGATTNHTNALGGDGYQAAYIDGAHPFSGYWTIDWDKTDTETGYTATDHHYTGSVIPNDTDVSIDFLHGVHRTNATAPGPYASTGKIKLRIEVLDFNGAWGADPVWNTTSLLPNMYGTFVGVWKTNVWDEGLETWVPNSSDSGTIDSVLGVSQVGLGITPGYSSYVPRLSAFETYEWNQQFGVCEMEVPFTLDPMEGEMRAYAGVMSWRVAPNTNPLGKPAYIEVRATIDIVFDLASGQVPIPPSFSFSLGGNNVAGEPNVMGNPTYATRIETRQKGIPQILLTSDNAWNFQATSRMVVVGSYSQAGIIGIAEDENNYLVGYIAEGVFGIKKVREGVEEVLNEALAPIGPDISYDLKFWHKDGMLGLAYRASGQTSWDDIFEGDLTTAMTYGKVMIIPWLSSYGSIATSDLIFHLGIYAYINPPKFRTTGYVSSSGSVPILPVDINPSTGTSDFINRFPDTGRIDMDGAIYSYTGRNRNLYDAGYPYMGPYQIRNITDWEDPFNTDRNGQNYQGGKAVEITQFNWWNGTEHALDFTGSIVGSSSGYNWLLDQTMWKVWITTGGEVVLLRNRARHYSNIPDYYPDGNEKFFLTDGLSGVTRENSDGVEYFHPLGTFVYLHNDDSVSLYGFSPFSGNHDQSIRYLIDKFSKIAGTEASFIGDVSYPTLNLIEDVAEDV